MNKAKKIQIRNSTAEFLVFTSQAGEQGIEVRLEEQTVWLTQKLMAALFEVDVRTVSEHLGNIFSGGELNESAVVRKFRNTAADGKQYLTSFYNLDAIIAVGFRVNSLRATQFRQWAIGVLRDFAIRGYVLDKERLKNGAFFNEGYFDHLLEEICEIRASERRFLEYSTNGTFWITPVRSPPKLQRHLPKASLKNTASFKTSSLNQILTECFASFPKRGSRGNAVRTPPGAACL